MYAGFTPAVLCLSFAIPTGTDETNLTESRYDSVREQNLSAFPGIYSVAATHQAEPGRNSRPRPSLFFFPRRSRLGRYLFCRRRSLKGRQNRCRPDFLGFMRVFGHFESEFSSTLHRRCPNPELDIFPFAGPFIRFFGKGSPFRLV